MGKTGLIVEGGGMKCAYSAGILDRFLDDKITIVSASLPELPTPSPTLPASAAEICASIPYTLTIRAIFPSAACFGPGISSGSNISTER